MSPLRIIGAAFLMVLVTGCGGPVLMPTPNLYALTPDNPFPDVPPGFRTSTVDVLYATDRAAESDAAQNPQYGYRRSRSLAFGMTTVRIGKDVSWDALVAASRSATRPTDLPMSTDETRELGRFPPAPSKTVERDGQIVDAPEVMEARRAAEDRLKALVAERLALTPKKEVYVFVHGTGSNFEEPTYVLAGLWHFMGRCGVPVAYTWPAGGGSDPARGYAYDRESSEFTVYHLKQFLRLLAACPGVEKVHILAHSRGTDTVLAALRELNIEIRASGGDTRKALKLGCLVLAAADIDIEVSSQRVAAEHLMQVPEQMVLYVSPTDFAPERGRRPLRQQGPRGTTRSRRHDGQATRSPAESARHPVHRLPHRRFLELEPRLLLSSPGGQFRPDPPPARQPPPRGHSTAGRWPAKAGSFWRIDEDYPMTRTPPEDQN